MVAHKYNNQNFSINHVAISVPSLDDAADWYGKIFGFRRIRNDRYTDKAEEPDSPIYKIYEGKLRKVKVGWLSTGNSVGFEIFEFTDPPYEQQPSFEYWKGGFYHIGITAPNPEEVCAKACEEGAKQIGQTIDLPDGDKALYLSDPWGNVVEVLSVSFEQLMANRG